MGGVESNFESMSWAKTKIYSKYVEQNASTNNQPLILESSLVVQQNEIHLNKINALTFTGSHSGPTSQINSINSPITINGVDILDKIQELEASISALESALEYLLLKA